MHSTVPRLKLINFGFLLQVLDNHVIRYIPPEKYATTLAGEKKFRNKKPLGCLVVGAEATNPERVSLYLTETYYRCTRNT